MNKRITIKDIAKQLNIHHSTVSRALRNDTRVNEITRKLIVEYAGEHGYQINMNALQLRRGVKNVIAVIVPNINHSFFSNIVSTIADLAYQDNYTVSVFQSNEKLEREKEIIDTIIQHNVAGVIVSVSMETTESNHFSKLKKLKIPLVMFDRVCEDINVSKVLVNNSEVVSQAVEILISKGYQRIAHITGTELLNVYRDRQNGYSKTLASYKNDFRKRFVVNKEFTLEDGRTAVSVLFADDIKPDAVICDSYILLLGALQKLKEMNLKIPGDVGLLGFGESPSLQLIQPRITTISQPHEEVASKSYELLINQINRKEKGITESITISARIIEGESC